MKPTLRPTTDTDFAFAFEVKKDAMGPHISSRWGWDEKYQLDVHQRMGLGKRQKVYELRARRKQVDR
jgi:hypothetical protein